MANIHRPYVLVTILQLDNAPGDQTTAVEQLRRFIPADGRFDRYQARVRSERWTDGVDNLIDAALHAQVHIGLKDDLRSLPFLALHTSLPSSGSPLALHVFGQP